MTPPPPDTGLRLFLRSIVARAYPRIIGQQREKTWIFFETFLPFLGTAGYVFVYRAIQADENYVRFAIMGGAMTAFWLNVMWSMSAQLYWEKEGGNLALYIMSPTSLMSLLMGMALGGMLATTLRALIITVLGVWLFNVQFTVSNFALLFLVFILTMAALYGLGSLLASLFLLWGREAWQIVTALQEPIYFVSGFYFPVKNLGNVLVFAASLLPLTLGMDAMRQLVSIPGAFPIAFPLEVEIMVLLALAIFFVVGAKYALDIMERKAMAEGTLTDRRR